MESIDSKLNNAIGHLFRHHSGQLIASLCHSFGFDKLETVEDAVQDALIAAMKTWPYTGMPENQFAWLLRTAKNRCIDILRCDNRLSSIDDGHGFEGPTETPAVYFANEIGESSLRMIFACCHPEISPDSRVALTLKAVGGFSVAEIASAFISSSEAVTKLLSRAKSRLRDLGVRLEIPKPNELPGRVDSVLKALYLMFNEGYSASSGETLLRKDLVFEAIRLVCSLATHPVTTAPSVDALAALFHFQAARMPTRSDHNGELLILAEQDRNRWDKRLISQGIHHLRLSASGDFVSDFHLEAEIAALYTLAADYDSTNWKRILAAYEKLQKRQFSPVIELNRAIVLGEIYGPHAAYEQLMALESQLAAYNLFFITKGHYEARLYKRPQAAESLQKALRLTKNESVRQLVQKRLAALRLP